MARYTIVRAASLALSIVSALTNLVVAAHVLSLWRVLRWESESEWEGSADGWRVDSIKLVWLLLAAYFSTATVICLIGAFGVIKRAPSFVRLYRDYSLADICFCALLTTATAAVSFRPGARAIVCEEISGQPELLRDLADAGLNVENCEQWFEHAVLGFVGVTAILLIVRLQFFFTVSSFYKQLMRQNMYGAIELSRSEVEFETPRGGSPQRIFLLPARHQRNNALLASGTETDAARADKRLTPLIYAPVPLDSLSEAEARQLKSNEAWVSRHPGVGSNNRQAHPIASYARSNRHGYLQPSLYRQTGLPVLTEEGALPPYTDDDDDVKA